MNAIADESRLELHVADSMERTKADARPIPLPRSEYRVAGVRQWKNNEPEPAELDKGILFIGCRDCNDSSPDGLRIQSISATGFFGIWGNGQSGIGRVVHSDGSLAPNPGGRFCAQRMDMPPADHR